MGDERDLIGVRAAHRGEEVYLYQLTTPVPVARAILLDYVDSINQLAEEAAWYNALTHNCTTSIRRHVQNVAANNPFDWRILVNGYLPQLGYERGRLDQSLPLGLDQNVLEASGRCRISPPACSLRRIRLCRSCEAPNLLFARPRVAASGHHGPMNDAYPRSVMAPFSVITEANRRA